MHGLDKHNLTSFPGSPIHKPKIVKGARVLTRGGTRGAEAELKLTNVTHITSNTPGPKICEVFN